MKSDIFWKIVKTQYSRLVAKHEAKKRSKSKKERKKDRKLRVKKAIFRLTCCKTWVFDQFRKERKVSKKQYFVWLVAKYEIPPASAAQTRIVKKTIFLLTCCKTLFFMKNHFFEKLNCLNNICFNNKKVTTTKGRI